MTSAVARVRDVDRRGEGRGDGRGLDVGVAVGRVARAELGDVLLGAVERLRLAHAGDLFLQARRSRRRPSRAAVRKAAAGPAGEAEVVSSITGMIRKQARASLPFEQEHRDDDADQAEHGAEQLGEALAEELVERIDVVETRLIRSPIGRRSKKPSGRRWNWSKSRARSAARMRWPMVPMTTIWPAGSERADDVGGKQ